MTDDFVIKYREQEAFEVSDITKLVTLYIAWTIFSIVFLLSESSEITAGEFAILVIVASFMFIWAINLASDSLYRLLVLIIRICYVVYKKIYNHYYIT